MRVKTIDELELTSYIKDKFSICSDSEGNTEKFALGNIINPIYRVIDNKLNASYDGGVTFEPASDYIASYFRWSNNNTIQISNDNLTWTNLSEPMANNLFIKGYVDSFDQLPSNEELGAIYMVGTAAPFHMYVKTSNGWVDNGAFTSIQAGVVQEMGDNENVVMSQKAVTDNFISNDRIVQETGDSETLVMSQKAVSEEMAEMRMRAERNIVASEAAKVCGLVKLDKEQATNVYTGHVITKAGELKALGTGLVKEYQVKASGMVAIWGRSPSDDAYAGYVFKDENSKVIYVGAINEGKDIIGMLTEVPDNAKTIFIYGVNDSDTALCSTFQRKRDICNIDDMNPLSEGYHTFESAVNSVPSVLRNTGLIITYRDAARHSIMFQYVAANANDPYWGMSEYWVELAYREHVNEMGKKIDNLGEETRASISEIYQYTICYKEKGEINPYSTGSGYVAWTKVGKTVRFGSFGSHKIYRIPSGVQVKVNNTIGGSYCFALCDENNIVVEIYSSENTNAYIFNKYEQDLLLLASENKLENVISIDTLSTQESIDDIKQIIEEVVKTDETENFLSVGDFYIKDKQTLGGEVAYGAFSKHRKYFIPSGAVVEISVTNEGSYGYALVSSDGLVLDYCSSENASEYTFERQEEDCYLLASEPKLLSVTLEQIRPKIDSISERVEKLENYWKGKTLWWCGTSIPAGSDATLGSEETIAGNYPTHVGNILKCSVINKSVGGSMCRANVRTGDYNGVNFSNITSALTMTNEEIENFITNYNEIRKLSGNITNPSFTETLSESDKRNLRAASFEKRLMPYLDGTYPMPDLFVFDHGHNDFKYTKSDGTSDIGLQPTRANILSGELAEDVYMTANNNEKLVSFFGSLNNVEGWKLDKLICSLNRNCYIGAVNFLITLILSKNPRARIVFISNYEYENGERTNYAPLIEAQESLAESWAFPLCKVYQNLGYSSHIIPGTKDFWASEGYNFEYDISPYYVYNPDTVHPHSDVSGTANKIYAGVISEFIKTCR
ncbi:MAG: hypothetical protein IKT40_09545 [Bacilli bacterium]|nr:hypothetical protein [Bacilli bacterium]